MFTSKLDPLQLVAWEAFKNVVNNFLGNHRAENYVELVQDMMEAYKKNGMPHVSEDAFSSLALVLLSF